MKKIMIIAAAVAAMAACTKSTVVYEDSTEIGISPVNYNTTKLDYGPIKGTEYPTSEDFGVFAYHTTDDAGTNYTEGTGTLSLYLDNVGFTYRQDGQWGGKATSYYWPRTGSLYFAGYSPLEADIQNVILSNADNRAATTTMNFTNFTQGAYHYSDGTGAQDDNRMVDLMWFDLTSTSANTGAPAVTFRHALSYLTFAFSANVDNIFTVESVTLKQVNANGSFTSWDETASAPAWSGQSNPNDISLYNTTAAVGTTNTLKIDDVLVIPQGTAEIEIVYTQRAAAGQPPITQKYNAVLTGGDTDLASNVWLYNRHYTYNIYFTANEIRITPSVDMWIPVDTAIPVE